MSAFSPEVPPIPRPSEADLLGRFVPSALRRTPSVAKLWRLPRLVVVGVLSAGFFPCLALQSRVRKVLMMHAQQCELSADLLAKHLPAGDAAVLDEAARGVRVPLGLIRVSTIAMILAGLCAAVWIGVQADAADAAARYWLRPLLPFDRLVTTSLVLLSLAYLFLIVQINRQVVVMQQFALAFNAVCGERLTAIEPPALVWGLSVAPLIVGGVMTYFGLAWALPMMLAWAAFASFVRGSGYRFRVRLAERLQQLCGLETVVPLRDLCPNVDCRSGVPAGAGFCPRCGTAVVLVANAHPV